MKNRRSLKGRTKVLEAVAKARTAQSIIGNLGYAKGKVSNQSAFRSSKKAGAASMRATRSKMGLRSNPRAGHNPRTDVSQYHSEDLSLQEFFDKKAYMATYNKNRYGSKKASLGRRKATSGLGRLNRSKKITKSNPSAASTARIARLGLKRGMIQQGSSKTGMKSFVRGFAKARKTGQVRGGISKSGGPKKLFNAMGSGRQPQRKSVQDYMAARVRASESEQYFDKKAYMKAYNAKKRGGGTAPVGSSLARVRGARSTPSAFKLGKVKSDTSAARAQQAARMQRQGGKPLNMRRKVTRKGGLNPRARGPRKMKYEMRPGMGQHVPNKYGGGGPD